MFESMFELSLIIGSKIVKTYPMWSPKPHVSKFDFFVQFYQCLDIQILDFLFRVNPGSSDDQSVFHSPEFGVSETDKIS